MRKLFTSLFLKKLNIFLDPKLSIVKREFLTWLGIDHWATKYKIIKSGKNIQHLLGIQ